MSAAKRPYRQTARAAASEDLRRKIVVAFHDLLLTRWIEEVTLDEVAASAGTTRQTVIRLFDGKEGVLEAALEFWRSEAAPRFSLPMDASRRAAIEAVVDHYESIGDMTFRFLSEEARHPALRPGLEYGRREHRSWVSGRFAAALAGLGEDEREGWITRLVVATDVYTWKLLRRDFGKSRDDVVELMAGMVESLIEGVGHDAGNVENT